MAKVGIQVPIPGFGDLRLTTIVTDYTGTHACGGKLVPGAKERLKQLADLLDIYVLTSDTFGTVKGELEGVPHKLVLLEGRAHDRQKYNFVRALSSLKAIAAFGNGNNDREMLRKVRKGGGVAVAVDNGEGCAVDSVTAANIFIHGSCNALDLLLEPKRLIASLRS